MPAWSLASLRCDATLDRQTVGAQNFANEGAALLGADEFQSAQAQRIDPVAQDGERLGRGQGGFAAAGIEFHGKAGGIPDLVARDARHGFDDDEFARRWIELKHAKVGDDKRPAGPVAMRLAFGLSQQPARRPRSMAAERSNPLV